MTEMLTRSVIDNRFLRETGQLDTTLGAATRSVFETPSLGDLVADAATGPSLLDGFTEEQRFARRQDEAARWRETDQLQRELLSVSDAARRDEIDARLDELQQESETQLDELTRESLSAGRLKPKEELQEQFGELGLTFDRAMTQDEVDFLVANKREEITRNAIIEAGPKGVLPGVVKFGAGLASVAVDPVEVATMFIPVVGQAGRAASVAKFGRVGGRALVGATEGLVGNAITEPLYFGLSRAQQLDYAMSDALTNVGLGALFGGVLGAGVGVFSRADVEAPRIDSELAAQTADIALRQFATGKTINISRLLDGTDLRSTTAISRVGGIEFQSARIVDLPVGQNAEDLRPTVALASRDGLTRTFDTLSQAEEAAEKIGGTVQPNADGFTVRQPIDGEVVRDPFGKPLTFKTDDAAQEFIGKADLPKGTKPIRLNVNGEAKTGVVHGMDAKDIRALEQGADTAEIPDGINTREAAILPDAGARLDEAIRRTFAESQIAREFANDAENLDLDPQANFEASARADIVLPETFATETVEEMDNLVRQLDELGELSEQAKADLAEIDEINERAKAYTEVTQAAANCLLRA